MTSHSHPPKCAKKEMPQRFPSAVTLLDPLEPLPLPEPPCKPVQYTEQTNEDEIVKIYSTPLGKRVVETAEGLINELFRCGPLDTPPQSPVLEDEDWVSESPGSGSLNDNAQLNSARSMPSPASSPGGPGPSPNTVAFHNTLPSLSEFIMRLITRTRLDLDTLLLALLYCKKLKRKHPQCRGSHGTGHRLFLAGLLLACKYLHDDAYENSSLSKASGVFATGQVNEIEYEFLYYLDWELHVRQHTWLEHVHEVETRVGRSLRGWLQWNVAFEGCGGFEERKWLEPPVRTHSKGHKQGVRPVPSYRGKQQRDKGTVAGL